MEFYSCSCLATGLENLYSCISRVFENKTFQTLLAPSTRVVWHSSIQWTRTTIPNHLLSLCGVSQLKCPNPFGLFNSFTPKSSTVENTSDLKGWTPPPYQITPPSSSSPLPPHMAKLNVVAWKLALRQTINSLPAVQGQKQPHLGGLGWVGEG